MSANAKEDQVAKAIVDCALKVHKELGPGLLEKVYEACLAFELENRGFCVERQKAITVEYGGKKFDEGFRLDLLVNGCIIVELKAAEKPNPLWQAQLLSYMKLSGKKLGLIINFHTPLIKYGIQRMTL